MDKKKGLILGSILFLIIVVISAIIWLATGNDNDAVVKDIEESKIEKEEDDQKDKEIENHREEDHLIDSEQDSEEEEKEEIVGKEEVEESSEIESLTNSENKSKETEKIVNEKNSSSANSSKDSSNSNTSDKKEQNKPKDNKTTKTSTSTETIPFKTIEQNDDSLEKGKTKVAQDGQNGTRTITYKETYVNGKLVSKEQVSSKVTKQPIDKIVKVGTKEAQKAPKYLSATEADNILSSGGLTKSGNTYTYAFDLGLGADIVVIVGSNHVTDIVYSGHNYQGWDMSLADFQEILGEQEGKKQYDFAQSERSKIENAVRAAANAVYGSGTSHANQLYNEIINSGKLYKSF